MKKYDYIDGMDCFDVYPADEVDAKIAELEAQFKRACHVVEVNRQAKWKAENRVADLEAENARLREALEYVQDTAHAASTGPEVPDQYWNIRFAAQEALKK